MPLIVQKFGGTSVADAEKILKAARRAIRAKLEGNQVVMVVSAMGHNTDHLIDLARQVNERPPAREMDMLLSTGEQVSVALMAMAIHRLGHSAISLTGAQIGIKTDSTYSKARIRSIDVDRVRRLLDEGQIVIAAGFQGIDEHNNITTLGRGGSDTTAVALAAVLDAACEIYTDVDGIYTTDPRIVPEARRVERISYDEMLELASLGAGVMHSRAVEFGKKFDVPIHVRSSFSDAPGSWIVAQPESPDQPVCGAALVRDEARVTVAAVPDRPGISHAIFSSIAQRNVTVDMIVQNVGSDGLADISFTVPRGELHATLEAVQAGIEQIGGGTVSHDDAVAKVSVVGLGMARQTGVAQRMFRALADAGINIQMISTSEIKISALVARQQAAEALRAVHEAFELHQSPARPAEVEAKHHPLSAKEAVEMVSQLRDLENLRLRGMEDLSISGIALDESQARVTLRGVPDRPGLAAAVFDGIARQDVFVDMIVQSAPSGGLASLTFTVPQQDLSRTLALARQLAETLECGQVAADPQVAKLSVMGIGMRSHSAVAQRMFEALAQAGINVGLISTSEVRVNVIVDGKQGQAGRQALEAAFSDSLV